MTAATVLVPTHDHGPMLYHSVGSALTQTVDDVEVFIVGDGVDESTHAVALELARRDERVRFFDNPKGPHVGEVHRHAALEEARSPVVCYLGDDDLWLPEHVATMLELLSDADLGHTLPAIVLPDERVSATIVDLTMPYFRQDHVSGSNWLALAFGAHTLAAYRTRPGWRTARTGEQGDAELWRQFLADESCRVACSQRVTALKFAAHHRPSASAEARVDELRRWSDKLADPEGRTALLANVLDEVAHRHAHYLARRGFHDGVDYWFHVAEGLRGELETYQRELDTIRRTRTWRAHSALARRPGFRWAAGLFRRRGAGVPPAR